MMPNTIQVKSGETFQIPLQSSAGTGFRWEVELSDQAAQHVTLMATEREATSTVPGAPTTHTFHFRALASGKVTLPFRLRRSWEAPDSGTVQTIEVQIDPA
jgi:predicted secreted protein